MATVWGDGWGGFSRSHRRMVRREQVRDALRGTQVVPAGSEECGEVEEERVETASRLYSPEGYKAHVIRLGRNNLARFYQAHLERGCTFRGTETMSNGLHILVKKDVGFWGDALGIVIYERDNVNGTVSIASPLVMNTYSEGSIMPHELTIGSMRMEAAVRLMDSLYEAGVRPSRPQEAHELEIAALKEHINDLRKLLWNRLGVETNV